jgi:hypothetical protein
MSTQSPTPNELRLMRDWLNERDWSGCPMTVEPRTIEQVREVLDAIARYYVGGIAAWLRDQSGDQIGLNPPPWRVVPTTVTGAGSARVDIVSDGAALAPSLVASDILPDDARLIAASPALLAACEQAEFWLTAEAESSEPGATKPDAILRVLRMALGQVKGRA